MARYYKRTRFGNPYAKFQSRHLAVLSAAAVLLLVLGYLAYRTLSGPRRSESPANVDSPSAAVMETQVEAQSEPEPVLAEPPPPVAVVGEEAFEAVPEAAAVTEVPKQSETDAFIAEALTLLGQDPPRLIEARDRLNEALSMSLGGDQRKEVKKELSLLAEKWLFSRTVYPDDHLCGTYMVKNGDMLKNIGNEHKVPYQILMQVNGISRPELLRAGEPMKVIRGPFHAKICKSDFVMDIYLQDMFVRSFPVGLGRPGMETPTGLWLVKKGGKMISPAWTDPDSGKLYQASDPDYPLGSRWIGLEGVSGEAKGRTGFAIHGTSDPKEIGAATSRGCIRLHNGQAIFAYDILEEGSSQILVVK